MKHTKATILAGFIAMVMIGGGCAQQQPEGQSTSVKSIEFTFVNEAKSDATITAFIDGEKVYENKLISPTTAGGYFGQEYENKTLNVPDRAFTLKITEADTGAEKTTQLDPTNGAFVNVTYWSDGFIIQQTQDKETRID